MSGATTTHADYHTHTRLCRHATGTPVDYVRAAVKAGLAEIACTDHCPTPDGFGVEHRMQWSEFDQYVQAVEEARAEKGIRVLLGIEADYYPGGSYHLQQLESQCALDLVLGSVHFLDYWRGRGLLGLDPVEVWTEYFELVRLMAKTGLYDVAAHLDLPKRRGNPIGESALREIAMPALDALASAGMAIEINTSGLAHFCKELYPSLPMLSWARERGIGLTFGSDAHEPAAVGSEFAKAAAHARAAGYTHLRRYHGRRWTEVPL